MSQGIIVCRQHEIGDGLTGMKELDNQVVAAKFDNKNTSIQFAETFAETQLIFLLLSFSNNLLNIALIFCVTSFLSISQ